MINVRTKGATGEREIAALLNDIVMDELRKRKWNEDVIEAFRYYVQRNSNQSSVGGKDLINTFGYAIEIKRHQVPAIKKWWEQCCQQAYRLGEEPVLLYRANRKPWRVVLHASIQSPFKPIQAVGEFDFDVFLQLFRIRASQAVERSDGEVIMRGELATVV
jgi:hypothetical protein